MRTKRAKYASYLRQCATLSLVISAVPAILCTAAVYLTNDNREINRYMLIGCTAAQWLFVFLTVLTIKYHSLDHSGLLMSFNAIAIIISLVIVTQLQTALIHTNKSEGDYRPINDCSLGDDWPANPSKKDHQTFNYPLFDKCMRSAYDSGEQHAYLILAAALVGSAIVCISVQAFVTLFVVVFLGVLMFLPKDNAATRPPPRKIALPCPLPPQPTVARPYHELELNHKNFVQQLRRTASEVHPSKHSNHLPIVSSSDEGRFCYDRPNEISLRPQELQIENVLVKTWETTENDIFGADTQESGIGNMDSNVNTPTKDFYNKGPPYTKLSDCSDGEIEPDQLHR